MGSRPGIRRAQSCVTDAREAVQEFHAAVAQPEMALVIFFCSVEYDLEAVAEEMDRLFDGVQVVGCTTAGEIGPAGYRDNSISGASFPAEDFTAASGLIGSLRQFGIAGDQAFPRAAIRLGRRPDGRRIGWRQPALR